MLSVLSIALAAVLGSACGTNMANINDCNAALYNTGDYPQAAQYQRGGQDLSSMLSQMDVSMTSGDFQRGINQAYYYIIIFPKK